MERICKLGFRWREHEGETPETGRRCPQQPTQSMLQPQSCRLVFLLDSSEQKDHVLNACIITRHLNYASAQAKHYRKTQIYLLFSFRLANRGANWENKAAALKPKQTKKGKQWERERWQNLEAPVVFKQQKKSLKKLSAVRSLRRAIWNLRRFYRAASLFTMRWFNSWTKRDGCICS